jgi:hypothetical protein
LRDRRHNGGTNINASQGFQKTVKVEESVMGVASEHATFCGKTGDELTRLVASSDRFWPEASYRGALPAGPRSDFGLLGNLKSVINLDAQVSHRAFELRMAKE